MVGCIFMCYSMCHVLDDSDEVVKQKQTQGQRGHGRRCDQGGHGRGGRGRGRGRGGRGPGGRGQGGHGPKGGGQGGHGCGQGQGGVGDRRGKANELPWKDFSGTETNPQASKSFIGSSGPSETAQKQETPLDYLYMLLGLDIFHTIADQSNLYASQKGVPGYHTTPEEIAAFLGINIAMGIVNLPTVREYWSTNPILCHPWFGQVMSRDRFYNINRYLHFNDNNDQVHFNHDKLFKIRPVIELVQKTFVEHYVPSRDLSIDEQMIGTKGRISFLQYLPKKPKKWGIKIWVLADSSIGYVSGFDVYTGASERSEDGLAYSVVMNLMDPYISLYHRLYIDNFYTSPKLLLDLLDKDTCLWYCVTK